MRRLLSILLLALFAAPLLLPLLALTGSRVSSANLPACCRRDGAHHCAMSPAEQAQSIARTRQWSTLPDRCPFHSAALASTQPAPFTPTTRVGDLFSILLTHPSGITQTESRRRIARERSRHKRGPPRFSLS